MLSFQFQISNGDPSSILISGTLRAKAITESRSYKPSGIPSNRRLVFTEVIYYNISTKKLNFQVRKIQVSQDQLLSELNLEILILKLCRPVSERQMPIKFIATKSRTEISLDLHSASEDAWVLY